MLSSPCPKKQSHCQGEGTYLQPLSRSLVWRQAPPPTSLLIGCLK
uniref:Uncharacterized protein n=1 Tax=Anguilla anguilla TaxID=7936 RepID=A0A0E9TSS2_ANGAN